jgi:aquaporin rerated protein, other eukaryote
MFLTAQLVLVIFMTAVETHDASFLAPVAIGLTLFIAHIAAIFYTGSSLNPARSFGPDLVIGKFPTYHWIYCTHVSHQSLIVPGFGPLAGALLATGIYKALKWVKYEQFSQKEPEAVTHDRREIQKDSESSLGTNFQAQGEYV